MKLAEIAQGMISKLGPASNFPLLWWCFGAVCGWRCPRTPGLLTSLLPFARLKLKAHYLGADVERSFDPMVKFLTDHKTFILRCKGALLKLVDFMMGKVKIRIVCHFQVKNFYQNYVENAKLQAFVFPQKVFVSIKNTAAATYLAQVVFKKCNHADMRGPYLTISLAEQEVDRPCLIVDWPNHEGLPSRSKISNTWPRSTALKMTFADWKLDLTVHSTQMSLIDDAYDLVMKLWHPGEANYFPRNCPLPKPNVGRSFYRRHSGKVMLLTPYRVKRRTKNESRLQFKLSRYNC